jgi:hypothetical protein
MEISMFIINWLKELFKPVPEQEKVQDVPPPILDTPKKPEPLDTTGTWPFPPLDTTGTWPFPPAEPESKPLPNRKKRSPAKIKAAPPANDKSKPNKKSPKNMSNAKSRRV